MFLAVSTVGTTTFAAEKRPKTLFDLLFNKKNASPDSATKTKKPRSTQGSVTTIKADSPKAVEKLETANQVLVIGDFMASSLAKGLAQAFEAKPNVVISNQANGSSGLVRQDYYDWQAQFPKLLDDEKPAIAIVQIGSNDRQAMRLESGSESFNSATWLAEYEKRIDGIISAAAERNVLLLWVGLPPFGSTSLTADVVTLNSLFRSHAEKAAVTYVDIWDGFADEAGGFVYSGSDIDGQQVRLRGSDGIVMTKAGQRKLAFYVEKYIHRTLGSDATSFGVAYGTDIDLSDLKLGEAKSAQITRTEPMAISDPTLDGADLLLDPKLMPHAAAESPLEKLLKSGDTGPQTIGRADYVLVPPNAGSSTQ